MPSSPTRAPARTVKLSSPARTALATHLDLLRQAQIAADEARRPLDRARFQVTQAEVAVRTSEAAIAALDEKETKAIREWDLAGSPSPPPVTSKELRLVRADEADALAAARRMLDTVRRTADAAIGQVERAQAEARAIGKQTESAAIAVLIEESEAALTCLVEANIQAATASSSVRSFVAALVARGRFTEAERINTALYDMARPRPDTDETSIASFIDRLMSDADATVAQ